MRARVGSAVLVAGVVAGSLAPVAVAGGRSTSVQLRGSGSVRVVWHGDPGAGCAAAGMCGYSGSIVYPASGKAYLERDRFDGISEGPFGFLASGGRIRVRVRRQVAGGPPAVCRESADSSGFSFDSRRAYRGRYSLELGLDSFPDPLVSGRCAGPLVSDFADSLPSATIRLREVERRGTRTSLAGRFPFRAGPLTGEVTSTLVLRTRRTRTQKLKTDIVSSRGRRTVFVTLSYSVERASGQAAADFRAVESPTCQLLDACGARGRETYSLPTSRGSLDVYGYAPAPGRRKPKLRQAIAMALRHGTLTGLGEPSGRPGHTANLFTRTGGAPCRDDLTSARPALWLETKHRRPRLALAPPDFSIDGGSSDVFAGRCPGPTQEDVFRREALASAKLARTALFRRTLQVVLGRSGRFAAGPYRGSASSRFELTLKRTQAEVTIGRELSGGSSPAFRRGTRR